MYQFLDLHFPVMYWNSVSIFFPTLLTLLGNVWFWYVMLLTKQYRIPACCWLAADHYRRAGEERCWQDTTSQRGHVRRDLGKYGMYFQVFMKRVAGSTRRDSNTVCCANIHVPLWHCFNMYHCILLISKLRCHLFVNLCFFHQLIYFIVLWFIFSKCHRSVSTGNSWFSDKWHATDYHELFQGYRRCTVSIWFWSSIEIKLSISSEVQKHIAFIQNIAYCSQSSLCCCYMVALINDYIVILVKKTGNWKYLSRHY
jgi:hypothetical protein